MPRPLTANMKPVCATQPRQTTRGHTHWVTGVAHLLDGRRIITCSRSGSLRLWEIESGTQIGDDREMMGIMQHIVNSPTISTDGKLLVTGCNDKTRTYGTLILP